MTDAPIPDWRLLAPHRPLAPGDAAYVARPASGGDAIAKWIAAGGTTVLVSGPTGVGKSTELAHAAQALASTRVACLAQVDRMTNMHRLVADTLLHLLASVLVDEGKRQGVSVSQSLAGMLAFDPGDLDSYPANQMSGLSLIRAAVAEIERRSGVGRIALLIDGLEKLAPGPSVREIFDALAQLSESVDLVLVIPWHAAFAGGTEPILRGGERVHRVSPLETEGDAGLIAADFLGRVLAGRLRGIEALPDSLQPLLGRAFQASGGIPRVFLQLMADAGTYARAKREAAWPDSSDLSEAILDQESSFRRALLPGDTAAILAVDGTDGRELDVERRVRLLAQGILLERIREGRVSLEIHPLVVYSVRNSRP